VSTSTDSTVQLPPTGRGADRAVADYARMRVQDALCDLAAAPGRALEVRQALVDELIDAPPACLPVALGELHAITAYLYGTSEVARTGFRRTGVEGEAMFDELAALAYNPFRYAAGGLCDHDRPAVEHLKAVFGMAVVMDLSWPTAEEGCPICCYLADHVPDEPLLCDHPEDVTA
jgi:hypothetical protein